MYKLAAWIKENGEVSRFIQGGLDGLLDIVALLEELEIKSMEILEVHIYKEI